MEKPTGYLPRYHGYVLLPSSSLLPSRQRLSKGITLLVAIAIVSLVLNIVLVCKAAFGRYLNPLDDYQQLKHYPLVDVYKGAGRASGNAVVTTLYTDEFAPAVATLGHSLKRVNTTARLLLLYIPSQVSAEALCIASASGFEPYPVERIEPPHNGSGIGARFVDQYTKLRLWTLDTLPEPVRAVLYLDADCLVTRNFDELFALPYPFAAVPDVWTNAKGWVTEFNAGVMFLRPDTQLFHAMATDLVEARFPHDYAEQAFLNQYFATDVMRLPYAYNGNLAIKERMPAVWEGIRDEMRIIHYTLVKPFVTSKYEAVPFDRMHERVEEASRSKGGMFRDEMLLWGNEWNATRVTYFSQLKQCHHGMV